MGLYPHYNPMPKINVYLPDDLAAAVRDAQVPVSAVCQRALERAVREVASVRATDQPPAEDDPGLGLLGRFTPRARKALALAESAARDSRHDAVGPEHLLLGIIDEGENLAIKVLEALDVEVLDLRSELTASFGPPVRHAEERAPFSPLAKRALEAATREALGLGHNYIGCEHLLLGVLAIEDSLGSEVLRRMGVESSTTRRAVVSALMGVVHARSERPNARPGGIEVLDRILQRLDAIEERLARSS